MRVREEGKEGEGEEEVGEVEKFERKGRRGKEEILRVQTGEDGDKGVEVGEVIEAYPLCIPSCMLKCVPCVCIFMRMLMLFNVVKC